MTDKSVIESFGLMSIVLLFAGIIVYTFPYFHSKKLGYFSLVQLFYLVIIPGLLFPLGFSYILEILDRPMINNVVFSDNLLVGLILLTLLYGYGGVAIHTVTKMLSTTLKPDSNNREAYEMNRFLHLTFSHNLTYSAIVVLMIGLTLLELNHVMVGEPLGVIQAVLRGLGLGSGLLISMYLYDPYSEDAYRSRWNDLKWLFIVVWIGFVLLLYVIKSLNPSITSYQLLLPALLSIAFLASFSLLVVVRRIKRGGFKIKVNWKSIRSLLAK